MSRGSSTFVNILTVIVLLAACGMVTLFAAAALNPGSLPLPDFFSLPPLPTVLPTPLPTATSVIDTFPTVIPPTDTPTSTRVAAAASATPTASLTVAASQTLANTATVTSTVTLTPTFTITPTAATMTSTPRPTLEPSGPTAVPSSTLSALAFTLQPGSPAYQPNYANTAGCGWMGVAGQAFDLSGRPIIGLIVRVSFKDGKIDSITGTNKSYGEGGYEIFLNNHTEATTDAYRIQLLNSAGNILSDSVGFFTFTDCNRNLIVINFVQNH